VPPERDRAADTARAAARCLRIGLEARAHEAIARLADELDRVPCTRSGGVDASAIEALLARIVAAQERGDPIGLADVLEYELAPRLVTTR
jgi:hypothetical protein